MPRFFKRSVPWTTVWPSDVHRRIADERHSSPSPIERPFTMRKKPRFHSLKKLVRPNSTWMALRFLSDTDAAPTESQAGLVTLVAIQFGTAEAPACRYKNLLPAEMDRQIDDTCLPRRTDTRKGVEAHVQEEFARCRAHEPSISRQIRWFRAGCRSRFRSG